MLLYDVPQLQFACSRHEAFIYGWQCLFERLLQVLPACRLRQIASNGDPVVLEPCIASARQREQTQ